MIILLNHFEEQIGRLKRKDLSSAIQTEPINGIVQFEFTVEYGSNYKMDDVCFVGHRDAVDKNSFQLYKIIYQAPTNEGIAYECVHIAHDDLKGYGYIREARLHEVQASVALYKALEGSRWEVGTVDDTNPAPIYFYDLSRLECISKILDIWNLEIAYRVEIVRNKVVKRYIDLHHKRGVDTGRRYVYGSNALEVVKEVNQSSIYTASIPRGRGEEKFGEEGEATGGFGRRIDIKDIEWSKAKGDPIDKPLGQEYIELPEMTEAFGYSDGTPRFKINVYSNIEDPEQLIKVDYENLLKNSRPLVQFKANIEEFGNIELGDSVVIIRKDLDIFYKARVFSVKRNLLSGSTADIQLGDNLSLTQADFNKAIRKDISNSSDELLDSVKSAVSFMQNALTESMYDDDAYWYFLDMDNEYGYPAGFYTFNKPIESSPTKGVFIGGGKMAISNRKDSNGNMMWSTWATGDGLVADAITTGTLNADLIKAGALVGKGFNLDMESGAFNLANKISYNPRYNSFTIDGNTVIRAINNGTIRIAGSSITLDGNVNMTSSFTVPSGNIGDLSADKITSGTINASTINVKNLNADNLTKGTVGVGLDNASGTMPQYSAGAQIHGGATDLNTNSSKFNFIYARNAFEVQGRINAKPEGNNHALELNGLTLSANGTSCGIKPWGGYIRCEGNSWHFQEIKTSNLYLGGKKLVLQNGVVKYEEE